MRVADWVRRLAGIPQLQRHLTPLEVSYAWMDVAPEARSVLFAAQYLAAPRKVLLVVANYERALQWQAKLALCGVPDAHMRQLPSGQSALFEDAAPETMALSDRIGALRYLVSSGPGIVIAAAPSALERTLPREALERAFVTVETAQEIDLDHLLATLAMLGYEAAEPVRIPGQFSRRGGILDIYPMGRELPVRVELYGDFVESLREFDPGSQRSAGEIGRLALAPSRETLYLEAGELGGEARYAELLDRAVDQESALLGAEAEARLRELIAGDARALDAGAFFDRLDLYRPILHPDSGCALDLLPADGIVVLDDPLELEAVASRAEEELGQGLEHRAERGEMLRATVNDFMQPVEHLASFGRALALCSLGGLPGWLRIPEQAGIDARSLEPYRGRAEALTQVLKRWAGHGFAVVVATDQPNRAQAVLAQVDVFPQPPGDAGVFLAHGNLAGGFVLPEARFALVTDQELFGVGRLRLPQKRFHEGVPVATVLDLKPGDYVVHIHYGIGVFQGLTSRTVDGVEKEFLYIQYQAPDKLFVPVDHLDRIQKYLNPGDAQPKLNRLTGGEWRRTVGKAREGAREFARDLIRLYAQRKKVQRVSYGPDSPWQAEMEATFPWAETPAQAAAIQETKADLRLDYPMDRLICGDVGFGKTEVAIRAAFKVAQAGRQVAVLCPTTVLSEQHYRNFTERLAPWPVKVEILNRFRTTSERRRTLAILESGEGDVVIGTHALLSKGLRFRHLGLVIIDEEQKFGVRQKEALKELRVSVDVLSLSATPIPRTLSMALMDIRQMSLINDPPPGRLPIRTFVRPHADEVIREAILRELARGGQVYFVYNRVQGLHHVAERLRRQVPTARIGVGHGQMSEGELEPVMLAFIKGELDVLVSTTIVENGLDIPNANTLIVENADRFGLSQMYQLRGRVGRSDRQAYAYFLYGSHKDLSENAMARLQSLKEFSSLGSGYSLAFRDLQIRGAGELLGAKQHGTMATVGYELYTQLIHEEVQFLKARADGEEQPVYKDPLEGLTPLPTVDLPVAALVPEHYVKDQGQRLYCYKQMMGARTPEELAAVEVQMADRYGRLPEETARAFEVMRLRMSARDLEIDKIDGQGGRLAVSFVEDASLSPRVFSIMAKKVREAYLSRGQLIWPFTGSPIAACQRMLDTLRFCLEEVEAQRAALS
jgi:transcription-repair coupling factor (superfamily II helicase)